MSSSSDPVTETLKCSICLDVFNDPVSTPCGHNFCKVCLNTYWNNSQHYRCPNCNKAFKQRPDLKINIILRDIVDEQKKKTVFVCDICTEGKLKAVKSCLVCQSSYCETHLESHLRVSGLQKHKLIDPVKNLQDYICQKHDRPLGLFCRDDQTCVCLICTMTDHKNHNTVSLKESELQEMMEARQRSAEKQSEDVIKDQEQKIMELNKRNTELEMIAELQRATEKQDKRLIKDLEWEISQRNSELEMVKQKQITAEKQYENTIQELKDREQEITELKRRNTELQQQISKAENLLQEKHQKDEKSRRKFWFLVKRFVLLVLLCFIAAGLTYQITELKKRNDELKKQGPRELLLRIIRMVF